MKVEVRKYLYLFIVVTLVVVGLMAFPPAIAAAEECPPCPPCSEQEPCLPQTEEWLPVEGTDFWAWVEKDKIGEDGFIRSVYVADLDGCYSNLGFFTTLDCYIAPDDKIGLPLTIHSPEGERLGRLLLYWHCKRCRWEGLFESLQELEEKAAEAEA